MKRFVVQASLPAQLLTHSAQEISAISNPQSPIPNPQSPIPNPQSPMSFACHTSHMTEALRRLLDGIIDYAGLFPPAKLDMAPAIAEYSQLRSSPENWLVSRFICPASRLPELATELRGSNVDGLPLSITGTGGADIDAFESALEADAKAMTAFEAEFGDRAPIEALEIRLPSYSDRRRVISDLKAFSHISVFLELPWGEGQLDAMAEIAEEEWLGVKGRTGGLEAAAFPSCEQLARFLQQTVDLDLKFKLTAGLHHPIRHYHDSVKTEMHGFLNILFALCLHDEFGLGVEEIAKILEDQNTESFVLDKDGIRWNDLVADIELIAESRELFVAYGSCSVSEPVEDLIALGLLNGVS